VTVTTPTGHVCTVAGQIASLAKLAQRGSRLAAAYFVLLADDEACLLLVLSTAARDPILIASLAKLAVSMARSARCTVRRGAAVFVGPDETID